ncbi:MAG: type II toxin-antitoxin system RelB/DinJ family antitoxin [Ruminococcus sp.]|nr:type II toxin-antitoxin system RelB/DinJ family antitoxin [Candidatus Copronaster equi]
MANTTAVYARIDTEVKANAEKILSQLGISPSSAIQMLYSQIILNNGMPFQSKIPYKKPISIGGLTNEQLTSELLKGLDAVNNGEIYTAEEVDAELATEYNI